MVFHQPLRQMHGLLRSIAGLLGVEIAVPDFSTLSRRSSGLGLQANPMSQSEHSVQLVVDSTGLKTFGEGDWLEEKHKQKPKRKRWRKLHLGLDLVRGEIICSDLTNDHIGDPTALLGLLDQIRGLADLFLAEGAYDDGPIYDLFAARFGSTIKIAIPPPDNAVLSANAGHDPTVRDCHIAEITARGWIAWQQSSGYNQRSRVKTQMGRWKTVIGPKLKARTLVSQQTEAKIGVRVRNRMTVLGRPIFERIA
jgi:hypothetical protein